MNELLTAQEVIEVQQIVYRRLTDVFCRTNTKTHHALMNDSRYELRQILETSDMGFIAQFTPTAKVEK